MCGSAATKVACSNDGCDIIEVEPVTSEVTVVGERCVGVHLRVSVGATTDPQVGVEVRVRGGGKGE